MAMTGMQIYKLLPRTNCKDCGFPTCMAFAMQVASKQKSMDDCPHISEDAMSSLAESAAPPMKLINLGADGRKFSIGQETVMFRHEEKFHRPTGVAVLIPASLSDEDAKKKAERIRGSSFERVGDALSVALCAVEVDDVDDPAARVKLAAETTELPTIIVGSKTDQIKKAVDALSGSTPLIYGADASNIDDMTGVAAEAKAPLAVTGKDLEELADLTQKAKDAGVENIMLGFGCNGLGATVRNLTISRRAALKKQFRPLGYPTVVNVSAGAAGEEGAEGAEMIETTYAAVCAAKYGGIVIMNGVEPWQLLPVLTTIQDVYTDPQVPNTVEAKLHEVGEPNENSPVLFTTNFSLTYFTVEGEVERSKIPAYISVVDTEGLGVLNAYAGDKISAEKVVKTLQDQKVAEKVKHRKLIIPGLLPVFRAEIEDTSEWKEVLIGPERAREIPAFLTKNFK